MKGRTSLGHIFGQVSLVFFFMLSLAPMANIFICQTVIESFAGFIVCAVRVPVPVCVRVSHSMQIATGRRPDTTGISLPWRTVARCSLMLLKPSMSIRF